MKKTIKYIFGVLALAASFSCSNLNKTPEFKAEDSFLAFSASSVVCTEVSGTVSVPVNFACVEPSDVMMTYEVVDGTAKAGRDYELVDPTAVLSLKGGARDGVITFKVIPHEGEYTKDRSFTVNIKSAGDFNIGAERSCVVTIQDLDHPLAPILGSYTVTTDSNWDGVVSFSTELEKDPEDVSIVWISDPCNLGSDHKLYGNVSEDMATITFPLPQTYEHNGYKCVYKACDGDLIYDEGVITLTLDPSGATRTYSADMGFCANAVSPSTGASAGYFEIFFPPTTYVKD